MDVRGCQICCWSTNGLTEKGVPSPNLQCAAVLISQVARITGRTLTKPRLDLLSSASDKECGKQRASTITFRLAVFKSGRGRDLKAYPRQISILAYQTDIDWY